MVEKISDGERCIKYLREHNIGRATFMGIDMCKKQEPNRLKNFVHPNKSHRIFDLVKSKDDKYLNCFYFALKDTLVCDDIMVGSNIAYGERNKTYRVVTLSGELIENSGVMSGGGRPKKGLMSSKIVLEISEQ